VRILVRSPATEVRALRVTYVGELGWELHVPIGQPATSSMR
jgi:glycine cleavage system aminomethyltransferase T